MTDRHARFRRADVDPRRRPIDGFRAASAARFERLVDDALASLPVELRRYLDDVQLTVEDVPPDAPTDDPDGILLGIYQGAPPTARDLGPIARPDRLTLFRRPLEGRARNRAELCELVRGTVVHELALHLGIDDERLGELGWS